MKYSIIIPTFNHCEDLLKPCINSIIKNTDLTDVEVIVVSNGSNDYTDEFIRSLGEPFVLLTYPYPLGYTKATKLGIEFAKGEYIILLNNDTVLLDQRKNQWIEMLNEPFYDNSSVGITGPLSLKFKRYDFIVFFCAMIKKSLLDQFPLDDIFSPGSGEDIDFNIRIQKEGYITSVVNNFPIFHKAESTMNEVPKWNELFNKNMRLLEDRYDLSEIVKIVMPAYNSEKTIRKSIDSIINQTYKNWKLIIVDDKSTDNTWNIIKEYENHSNILLLQNEENKGVSFSRNRALQIDINSSLVAYCDSDDWWNDNHLDDSINYLNLGYDLVYATPTCFKESDGSIVFPTFPVYGNFIPERLRERNYIWISSVVHKNMNFMFDSNVNSLEDWDMWLTLMENGFKFYQRHRRTLNYLAKDNGMGSLGETVRGKVLEKHMIRLNLGCGDQLLQGWTNCDLHNPLAEKQFDASKVPYPDNTVDEIAAYHLIEHFKYHDAFDVLREWYRALKPGGKLTLETPDFLETCRDFVNGDEQWRIKLYSHFFAWPHLPGQTHYFLYTETQLRWTLEQCGFINIQRVKPDSIYARSLQNKDHIFLKVICEK